MGVAKVESHTCRMPLLLASLLTAVRSVSVSVGLAGDSEKMSFVLGLMWASMFFRSVKSMKSKVMPISVNMVRHARLVPPYEQLVITQWSPACIVPLMTEMVAAMPVPKHAAPAPDSRPAILFSSAVTVGLLVRAYEKPLPR